jgi:hypothetical protein
MFCLGQTHDIQRVNEKVADSDNKGGVECIREVLIMEAYAVVGRDEDKVIP